MVSYRLLIPTLILTIGIVIFISLMNKPNTNEKRFLIRIDVEAVFCVNGTCYWPEEGGKYPYNLMEKCLINRKVPDWSCGLNNFYSEAGFLRGLVNAIQLAKDENIKISLCMMGDVVSWMNTHRSYRISPFPPEFSLKKNGFYTVGDLIEDIRYYWSTGLLELGLHATRSEDLKYEINKRCGSNFTCAEEYFDWLIKTGIEDFELTFHRRPDYWHKHLGVGAIELINPNYSCIYLQVLEKRNIPIFNAHFSFTEEVPISTKSQVVRFRDYSIKEIPIGRVSEPILSEFPHFTTTWDEKTYIVTTHSWNLDELPSGYSGCPRCKWKNKIILGNYTKEMEEFIREAKKTRAKFITYKELSQESSQISDIMCQK